MAKKGPKMAKKWPKNFVKFCIIFCIFWMAEFRGYPAGRVFRRLSRQGGRGVGSHDMRAGRGVRGVGSHKRGGRTGGENF